MNHYDIQEYHYDVDLEQLHDFSGVSSQGNAHNEFTYEITNLRTYEFTKFRVQREYAMTSLSDRPITAASDDGVCRILPLARCQAVADTREIIEIKFDLHHKLQVKNLLKFGILIFLFLTFKNEFSRKEDSSVPIGWSWRQFVIS